MSNSMENPFSEGSVEKEEEKDANIDGYNLKEHPDGTVSMETSGDKEDEWDNK